MTETEQELKRLAKKATPGPWFVGHIYRRCNLDHGKGSGGHGGPECKYEEFARDTAYSAEGTTLCSETGPEVVGSSWDGAVVAEPDARFIAAANPAAILALLERVERMEAALGKISTMAPDDAQDNAAYEASEALKP